MGTTWLQKVEYGTFSLEQFRNDVAALAKYLIRAREKYETGFLGDSHVYENWGLADIAEDEQSSVRLLEMAILLLESLDHHMIRLGGSGGVTLDDPLSDFKCLSTGLTSESALKDAIQRIEANKKVKWEDIASWDELSEIRSQLDEINKKLGSSTGKPTVEGLLVAKSSRVILFKLRNEPIALIDGEPASTLNRTQYDVIQALLEAGDKGLTKDTLVKKSGHTDARGVLTRLANKYDDWKNVLSFAGVSDGGYRIF